MTTSHSPASRTPPLFHPTYRDALDLTNHTEPYFHLWGSILVYYAHSGKDLGRQDWQGLSDHLITVGALAETFGEAAGISKAAGVAGLLHDLGKYQAAFQARLEGSNERVDHSTAGAAIVRGLARGGDDAVIADLIAYAIAGHHTGLPDKMSADFSCLTERLKSYGEGALDPAWRSEIAPDVQELTPAFEFGGKDGAPFCLALLGRMIFSCLVDADYKDTEAFYGSLEGRSADRQWPSLEPLLPNLILTFDRAVSQQLV